VLTFVGLMANQKRGDRNVPYCLGVMTNRDPFWEDGKSASVPGSLPAGSVKREPESFVQVYRILSRPLTGKEILSEAKVLV